MRRKAQQTNRNFMYGTAVLAIAVILIVVIFTGLAFDMKEEQSALSATKDTYTLSFDEGFTADSYRVYINDSLLYEGTLSSGKNLMLNRFADDNALIIVDNSNDLMQIVTIPEKSGTFSIKHTVDGITIKKKKNI